MVSYDREQVNEMLRKRQNGMSLRAFALQLDVSAAYLSDVFRGNRDLGKKLLAALRLRKIKETRIRYVPERNGK